jgi:2-polyprenyl-6-methoxyphenol hydroxylase-like FAD-dependent oxidoreductase
MAEISLPEEWTRAMVYLTRLAGTEIGRMDSESMWREATAHYSPAPFLSSSQDRIEPVLRRAAAAETEAGIHFGHEVTAITQDADGVTIDVLSEESSSTYALRADWVIAADGASSFVRRQLGVPLEGQQSNRWYLNVHFHADLSRYTQGDRKGALLWVLDAEKEGVFQPLDGKQDWGCGVYFDADQVDPSEFDDARVLDLVRDMIDDPAPDIDIELIGFRPWFVSATVAQRYRSGRVFLAGDAAHQIPPFGGQGMNTGIQDCHNLAWKLAAVMQGRADETLLDTYDVERRQIAQRICSFGRRNVGHVSDIRSSQSERRVKVSREYGNWAGIDVGMHYNEGAIVEDGTAVPALDGSVTEYEPCARPGWRLPHRWLHRSGGERISTIDLSLLSFTLLTGPEGAAWEVAAADAGTGGDWVHLREGRDFSVESGPPLYEFFEIESDGAVLVRPDGHVAARWATTPDNADNAIAAVIGALALRPAVTAGREA